MGRIIPEFSRLECNLIFSFIRRTIGTRGCRILPALFVVCLQIYAAPLQRTNAGSQAGANPVPSKNTLVLGKVSNDPQKHYHYLKPMVDYAASHMQDLGIEKGSVLMAKDNAQMIEFLKSGKVDWVTETAYSALLYEQHHAAEILLRKWKKDASQYFTIFFARKESNINAISDLRGKVLALEDPGSTTAFFEPLMCLVGNRLAFEKLDTFKDRPSPDKVGIVFSRQEINSSLWVHKGLVAAAAFNNQDWDKSDHLYKNMKPDLKIFYRSEPIPRAFELVRTNLDPAVAQRLKAVLLKAPLDDKARRALRSYQETKQFDELDETSRHALEGIRNELLRYSEAIR